MADFYLLQRYDEFIAFEPDNGRVIYEHSTSEYVDIEKMRSIWNYRIEIEYHTLKTLSDFVKSETYQKLLQIYDQKTLASKEFWIHRHLTVKGDTLESIFTYNKIKVIHQVDFQMLLKF